MRAQLLSVFMAIAAGAEFIPAPDASAHIFYFDLQSLGTQTTNPDGSTTYALTASVLGNGAWANGTDADWGNSHEIPWYSFAVTNPDGANVTLSLVGGVTRVGALVTRGDLTPAFTLYDGLLPLNSHDGASALPLPDPYKDGGWQALADTTLANDADEIGTIQYLGHAGSVNSTAQTVSLSLFLAAGNYTVTPGGSCYECFPHYERLFDPENPDNPYYDPNYPNYAADLPAIEANARARRGFNMNLTIQPVPVPAAVYLFGTGLIGLAGLARRRMTTQGS